MKNTQTLKKTNKTFMNKTKHEPYYDEKKENIKNNTIFNTESKNKT